MIKGKNMQISSGNMYSGLPVMTPRLVFQGEKPPGANENMSKPQFQKPEPDMAFIKKVQRINKWLLGKMKVVETRLPFEDAATLAEHTHRHTASFVATNHPEFMTDMFMDKMLSRLGFPDMLALMHGDYINAAEPIRQFFSRLNVMPHSGGQDGKNHAIDWTLQGSTLLIHPEGAVNWHSDKINDLFPGIAKFPLEAAKKSLKSNDPKPVYIIPVVWKLHFTEDVSKGLHQEMKRIEKKLDLPKNPQLSLADRFIALQKNIIQRQIKKYGLPDNLKDVELTNANFFEYKEKFQQYLIGLLEKQYGQQSGSVNRKLRHLQRAINASQEANPKKAKADLALMKEIAHLKGFSAAVYNRPTFTQEHIAENLKRIQRDLCLSTPADLFRRFLPIPVGPRIADIRVCDPIDVTRLLKKNPSKSEQYLTQKLLLEVHTRMQSKLNEINGKIASELKPYLVTNKFYNPFSK